VDDIKEDLQDLLDNAVGPVTFTELTYDDTVTAYFCKYSAGSYECEIVFFTKEHIWQAGGNVFLVPPGAVFVRIGPSDDGE
jgi:hypothetical protein